MAKIHTLKTAIEHYQNCCRQVKKAELRFDDRGFKTGDILVLYPVDNNGNTLHRVDTDSCYCTFLVTHLLSHKDFPDGLKENYVMLSIKRIENVNLRNEFKEKHNVSALEIVSALAVLSKNNLV
jgi:hypothetical protein